MGWFRRRLGGVCEWQVTCLAIEVEGEPTGGAGTRVASCAVCPSTLLGYVLTGAMRTSDQRRATSEVQ